MLRELDSDDTRGIHSKGGGCSKGAEGFGGHHEGAAEDAKVCSITHFFGEDVDLVDGTRDVVEVNFLGLDPVVDDTVLQVDVAHALGGGALEPIDGALVVIV